MIVFAIDYDQRPFDPQGHCAMSDTCTIVPMRDVHTQMQVTLVVRLASAHQNTEYKCA